MPDKPNLSEQSLAEIARMLRFFVKLKLDELRDDNKKQNELIMLLSDLGFPSGEIADLLDTGVNSVSPVISRAKKGDAVGVKAR